jgi:hypothetical protein
MIEWLMVFGVGLMAGCLLMLLFIPLVHRRAVENTKRDLTETEPLTASAIQAERDQLRAQFAMAVRRLEIGVEDMRAKARKRWSAPPTGSMPTSAAYRSSSTRERP